eukprot:6517407-Pyramimonas_sp.AAC.5
MSNLDQSGDLERGRASAGRRGRRGAAPLSLRPCPPATRGGSEELPAPKLLEPLPPGPRTPLVVS